MLAKVKFEKPEPTNKIFNVSLLLNQWIIYHPSRFFTNGMLLSKNSFNEEREVVVKYGHFIFYDFKYHWKIPCRQVENMSNN